MYNTLCVCVCILFFTLVSTTLPIITKDADSVLGFRILGLLLDTLRTWMSIDISVNFYSLTPLEESPCVPGVSPPVGYVCPVFPVQGLLCLVHTVLSPSLSPQWKVRVGSDASLSSLIGSGEIGQSENELFGTKVQWSMCLNAHLELQTWLWFTVLFGEVLF